MKKNLCVSLGIAIVLSLCACGGGTDSKQATSEEVTEVQTTETEEPTTETEIIYAKDDVVNQFIADYNAKTQSEFTNIEKGNIKTKYFAESYGYYCELLNAADTDKICVKINETNENAEVGVSGMRDVFHDVVTTIDPSLTDEEVYACFDGLVAGEIFSDDVEFEKMTVIFMPDVELSAGHSRGHIEIKAK